MIVKIYYDEPDFIIDCIAECDTRDYRVTHIYEKGPKDTYLEDRKVSETDYFFVEDEIVFELPESVYNKMKQEHPERFL